MVHSTCRYTLTYSDNLYSVKVSKMIFFLPCLKCESPVAKGSNYCITHQLHALAISENARRRHVEKINKYQQEIERLKSKLKDAYIDGWTDGNAHKSYPPNEHRLAIEADWSNSITKGC